LQVGRGGSGPDYPLRTFVRDEQERLRAERERQEREQQERDRVDRDEVELEGRENEAAAKDRGRDGARGRERERPAADEARGGPSQSEGDVPYLLGEDSPLLLQNIPDYVIDTEPAIEAIKARLGEGGRVRDRSERLFDQLGKALYPSELPTHVDAELLSHRLRAFAVLDGETTRWLGGYYGAGEKDRVFYSILTSPDRLLTNREIKLPLLRLFAEEFPMSRIIGNIHADTDHKHCHVWMSARLANQLKLHMGWEDVGGVRVNRYKGVEERYLVNYCAVVGDPQPLATHLEKKAEWNARKGLVLVALKNGERPPAMPFRERLRYDELGERRQRRERRAREENGEDPGPKKRADPVARHKSSWECAELWGKTEHARARLADARHRRDAFERASRHVEVEVDGRHWSLHRIEEERGLPGRQREGKEEALGRAERERREAELRAVEAKVLEEVEARRQLLAREVEEHELDYRRHDEAWKKTIENRKEKKLPEIKYPLHNVLQLDEMRGIAERTRAADLLRYVREYDLLDRPEGRDELRREFAERWGREVMAEAGVHEESQRLRAALRDELALRPDEPDEKGRGDATARASEPRMLARLFDEWTKGGWSTDEVRQSLACVSDERLRWHAENYLLARDYHEATREVLRDYREGAEGVAAPPALKPDEVERIKELLSAKDAVFDKQAITHLDNVVEYASGESRISPEGVRRMVERSLSADGSLSRVDSRAASATERFDVARPLDDRWAARLTDVVALAETRALAAGMRETSVEKLEAARREAIERREMLEFVGWVRDQIGLDELAPVRAPAAERRELEELRRYVSQQLLRERPWTHEQLEQINEFGHRAPEKDQGTLADAMDRRGRRIESDRAERERRLLEERAAGLNEAMARADARFPAEVFNRLDLDRLREPERVREETERLARRYLDAAREQGLTPEQVRFRAGSAEDHARLTVDGTVERAERLRAAWVLAAADYPSAKLLTDRLSKAGVEVETSPGGGRTAPAVRLKFDGLDLDTRLLDRSVDVGKIFTNKEEKPFAEKERAVERCVQFALLSRGEQDSRVTELRNRSDRGRLSVEEEVKRAQYARLGVEAVRGGAAPDWKQIDEKILGLPRGSERGNEWLVKTAGMTRLNEMELAARTQPLSRPVSVFSPPDRGPTRNTPDQRRDGRNTHGPGSGRGRGGGR
jgi:hypothetical protein